MTTRQKLIEDVAKSMQEIPKQDVAKAVEIAFDYIGQSLIDSNRVEIRGFGSFNSSERLIVPSTNLGHIIYHHRKVRTINYRMSEVLLTKLNN